jgi:chromosome segregation ATPase
MLEKDKARKIESAEDKLNKLDDKIDDLKLQREDAFKKLAELKGLIDEAKAKAGKDDPDMIAKLKQLEQEAKVIEKDLKDIDDKIDDLKKKRSDLKKLIDDVKANPNKFTPQQIDEVLGILDDQVDKADGI